MKDIENYNFEVKKYYETYCFLKDKKNKKSSKILIEKILDMIFIVIIKMISRILIECKKIDLFEN
jgi:hypothetical protein